MPAATVLARSLLGTILATASLLTANAQLQFDFDYSASTDFNDPAHGAARRSALEEAAASLASIFDHTATIEIKVTSSNDPNGFTLAYASSAFVDTPVGFWQAVVMRKILTGIDDNGSAHDGEVNVNFGNPWDLDDDVSADAYDFKSTVIHELLHALGFYSDVWQDGTDAYGNPPGSPGVWQVFDKFLSDKDGTPVIDPVRFALDGSAWKLLSTGGTSPAAGLFFNGPAATAANGGQPVGLYSPSVWEDGSSGSHLDDWNPALTGLLMLSAADTGGSRRSLSDIERGILQDLGYTLRPLPVPTLALLSITTSGVTQLELGGPPERWFAIEYSDDLNSWVELQRHRLPQDPLVVEVELPEEADARFLRTRKVPPPAAANALRAPIPPHRR